MMTQTVNLFLIGTIVGVFVQFGAIATATVTNGCSFRGSCGSMTNSYGINLPIPCVFTGAPQHLNKTSMDILKVYLPEYLTNGDQSAFCCEDDQVEQILNQISIPRKMLAKCSSCYYNFARLFFLMTCAPNQHQFVRVVQSNQSTKAIDQLEYYLTKQHAHGLYDSCSEVALDGGIKVLPTLMCQPLKQNETCNAEKFLSSIGAKGISPMEIHFKTEANSSEIVPNDHSITSCAKAPTLYSQSACSCSDCKASCHA